MSEDLFKRAREVIPGGVNSPVRAYDAVGGTPRFIASARGSHLTDSEGNDLIDYVMSYGAIILGHADAQIADAVRTAVERGSSYGAATEGEVTLAVLLCDLVPSIEMVRLVSSGTEAAMSAVRLARGATGRRTIVKFEGCYHGHADALLASAGSGVATLGIPGTPGVTPGAAGDTIVVPYNDLAALDRAIAGRDVAAIIVEPVAANMGVVPPDDRFLEGLRARCNAIGAVLIFDEVITGFRLGLGGAQAYYGVTPDITLLGKVIGGGLPIGAFGGKRWVMEHLAPVGPVYQAGTLSGNPVAVSAGLAVLDILQRELPYAVLEARASMVARALRARGAVVNQVGSLFSAFFTEGAVTDYASASSQDAEAYARFFHGMLDQGIHLAPGAFEAWFVSLAHSDDDISRTLEAIART